MVVIRDMSGYKLRELPAGSVFCPTGSNPDGNRMIDGTCDGAAVLMSLQDLEERTEPIRAILAEGRATVQAPARRQHELMSVEYDVLRTRTQQTLIDFLNIDLDLGSSFARSALNAHGAGDANRYNATRRSAIRAAATVLRLIDGVEDEEARNEIGRNLTELNRLISTL